MRWQLSGSNGAHFVCSSRRLDSTMRLPTRWPASFTPRGPSCHLSAPPRASSPRPSAPPSRTPSRLRESRHYCGSMQTRLVDSIGLRQRREPQPMRGRLFLQAAAFGSVGVVPALRSCARVQDPANEGRAFPVRPPGEHLKSARSSVAKGADVLLWGVRLISVQEVTVHARPQSEHWRGVRSAPSRKCLSGNEFLLVLQSAVERLFVGSISAGGACFRRGL